MKYEIVPVEQKHIFELIDTMRDADRDEVVAQLGNHPAIGLGASVGSSEMSWAGLADGEVVCIWGVSADSMNEKIGSPWMLASPLLERHQRKFVRECRKYVDIMQDAFPILENFVDARNTTAIVWLKWLGFDIMPTEPHGPFGLMFHPFRRVRV